MEDPGEVWKHANEPRPVTTTFGAPRKGQYGQEWYHEYGKRLIPRSI